MKLRHGFSLPELAIAVALAGLVMAIGLPRWQGARGAAQMRSAKQHVGTMLATSRAAAIHRGVPVRLAIDGNVMTMYAEQRGGTVQIAPPSLLDSLYGVELEVTADEIGFDPRGMATLPGEGAYFTLTRGDYTEEICVTRFGLVRAGGC